jgi:hypothetical protein
VPLSSLLSNEALHPSTGLPSEKDPSHKHLCVDLAIQQVVYALAQVWVTLQHPKLKKQPAVLNPLQQALVSLLLESRTVIEHAVQAKITGQEALTALRALMQHTQQLANTVWALNPIQPPKQVEEFLNATLPLQLEGIGRAVVHPTMAQHPIAPSLVLEQLSPLHYNQLPQWFESLQHTLTHQARQLLMTGAQPLDATNLRLATDVLGIRLFGSGYYLYLAVLFLTQDTPAERYAQEPSLFQVLNYFDASTPHALRLHQNFNSLYPHLVEVQDTKLSALLKLIEDETQTLKVATEKELTHALALQDKFNQGILPATLQHHDTIELWEKMNTLGLTQESDETTDYNALHGQQAIYQLLPHINEAPVTERDIVLAAWLHRFDTSTECIEQALRALAPIREGGTGVAQWDNFCHHLNANELRTIKALETSRLHRMLFVPSASLPLGVEIQ